MLYLRTQERCLPKIAFKSDMPFDLLALAKRVTIVFLLWNDLKTKVNPAFAYRTNTFELKFAPYSLKLNGIIHAFPISDLAFSGSHFCAIH